MIASDIRENVDTSAVLNLGMEADLSQGRLFKTPPSPTLIKTSSLQSQRTVMTSLGNFSQVTCDG